MGKPYTVRYEAVNVMLLTEFLKEHGKVEEQQAAIAQPKALAAHQQEQIDALNASARKVSEKLELTKARPQLVTNR